ncbi:uncharacterized protein LOC121488630 isoform X2 [Vulpes lagopus]|uniref:uncharacterized protein LOC121488630 isoform X2 n=1 Tax=Vulpes lagopus TaxID=494514 RepID=UPI001BCA1776|nr:uncharacterized protein LOC121488630 isoform X2 [Vulpes lagopus]
MGTAHPPPRPPPPLSSTCTLQAASRFSLRALRAQLAERRPVALQSPEATRGQAWAVPPGVPDVHSGRNPIPPVFPERMGELRVPCRPGESPQAHLSSGRGWTRDWTGREVASARGEQSGLAPLEGVPLPEIWGPSVSARHGSIRLGYPERNLEPRLCHGSPVGRGRPAGGNRGVGTSPEGRPWLAAGLVSVLCRVPAVFILVFVSNFTSMNLKRTLCFYPRSPCSFCSSAPSNPASSAPSATSSYLFLHPCLLHRCLLCPFPPAPPPLPPLPLPPLALLSLLLLPLHPRPLRPFPSAPVPSTRQPPPGGLSALGLELQPQQDPGGPDTRRQEHTAVHCALRVCAPRPALRPGGHAATGHLPASVLPAQNDPAPHAHRVLHPGPGAQRLHPGLGVQRGVRAQLRAHHGYPAILVHAGPACPAGGRPAAGLALDGTGNACLGRVIPIGGGAVVAVLREKVDRRGPACHAGTVLCVVGFVLPKCDTCRQVEGTYGTLNPRRHLHRRGGLDRVSSLPPRTSEWVCMWEGSLRR